MQPLLIFSREFLESLPEDNMKAQLQLLEQFETHVDNDQITENTQEELKHMIALYLAFCEHRGIAIEEIDDDAGMGTMGYFSDTLLSVRDVFDKNYIAEARSSYMGVFKKHSAYQFSDEDFKRLQIIMNELRDLIAKSDVITEDHKRRLLRRLEAMQRELHKRTSDIDRFWGFIGEAGIVIGKFGNDIKPIGDRVQELGKIVIAVIAATEGPKALPFIEKLLGK